MIDVNATYAKAEQLKDNGDLPAAIETLQGLLREEPSHVLSHLTLAVLFGRVGDHENAVLHGERACDLEPTDPFNFTAMSVTYQRAWQGTQNQVYIKKAEDAMARAHALQGSSGH